MSEYGAGQISILKGLEAVKKRPGMYVGDVTTVAATHHLLYEIFDNSVDEALAGHATHIEITIHTDGSATVSDDGRGIPVAIHPDAGVSAAEAVLTTLHAGGKSAVISRYKGLGWETTMNPKTRKLQRITAPETERADRIFSDLMAENVAARRAMVDEMFKSAVEA